jgi:hypothetical protein
MGFFYKISCTGCDYQDQLFYSPTRYKLRDPNAPAFIEGASFQFHWCNKCKKVENVFTGTPKMNFDLQNVEWRIEHLKNRLKRFNGWLLIKIFYIPFQILKQKKLLRSLKEKYRFRDQVLFWEKLNYPKRCLACGGTDVKPSEIHHPNEAPYGASRKKEKLSVSHICGGVLLAWSAGHVSYATVKVIEYNLKGEVLANYEEKFK